MTHDKTNAHRPAPARRLGGSAPVGFRQRGFTLFEVLVATVILVIGVLGAAGMTLAALRSSHQSGLRSTAVALAYDIGESMRAYPTLTSTTIFIGASTAGTSTLNENCYRTGCTAIQFARNDVAEWMRKVTDPRILPGGSAVICRDSSPADGTSAAAPSCDAATSTSPIVVKIWWTEKTGEGAIAPVNQPNVTVTLQPL